MKNSFCLFIVLIVPLVCKGQMTEFPNQESKSALLTDQFNLKPQDNNPISKFALSLNPLGFLQFGPVINAEFGIKDNLVINTHVRLGSLGLLTYVVSQDDYEELDKLSGIGFGGGLIYFFGERMSKPYIGGLIEYYIGNCLYEEGTSWEWSEKSNIAVFIFNGGYRFRFTNGFFMNTGAYLGTAINFWDWEYTDPSYDPDELGETGTSIHPFGMLELTFGIEF